MGLQTYKQTASARAAGAASAAGGSKTAASRSAKNAYQDAYIKAMGADEYARPEGVSREEYATKYAEQMVTRTYTPAEIASAGIQMGGQPVAAPAAAGPSLQDFLTQAQKSNPDVSIEDLTKYYNENYGG